MKLTKTNPTPAATSPRFEVDRWFNDAFRGLDRWGSLFPNVAFNGGGYAPQTELYEDAENVYVRFDLPGFKKKDIRIEWEGGCLSLEATGRRRSGADGDEDGESYSVNRRVSVGENVLPEEAVAHHEDGVLTVTLPKAQPRRAKLIQIK